MKNKTFDAVLEDDITDLLDSLGLKKAFVSGQLKCSHCKKVLSKKNIFSLYPLSGDIKVSCSKRGCINKTMNQTENR